MLVSLQCWWTSCKAHVDVASLFRLATLYRAQKIRFLLSTCHGYNYVLRVGGSCNLNSQLSTSSYVSSRLKRSTSSLSPALLPSRPRATKTSYNTWQNMMTRPLHHEWCRYLRTCHSSWRHARLQLRETPAVGVCADSRLIPQSFWTLPENTGRNKHTNLPTDPSIHLSSLLHLTWILKRLWILTRSWMSLRASSRTETSGDIWSSFFFQNGDSKLALFWLNISENKSLLFTYMY